MVPTGSERNSATIFECRNMPSQDQIANLTAEKEEFVRQESLTTLIFLKNVFLKIMPAGLVS